MARLRFFIAGNMTQTARFWLHPHRVCAIIYLKGGTRMAQIIRAAVQDSQAVHSITVQTICAVYPHYYPAGAVEFFIAHHSDERIAADIASGIVYLLVKGETPVGTVTIRGNEICRLFVLPEYQGKGYGRILLDFAETAILAQHPQIVLDASLPAKSIYLRRGYVPGEFHTIETSNGDKLCYDILTKKG